MAEGLAISRIKTGKLTAGTDLKQIALTDLEPLTTYFVYCVLSGVSPGYSDVYCFQFTTDKVGTPMITLERIGSSSVSTTVSTAADVNWIVFPNTTVAHLGLNDLFDAAGNLADDIMREEFISDCKRLYPQKVSADGTVSVTIMEALIATLSPTSDAKSVGEDSLYRQQRCL